VITGAAVNLLSVVLKVLPTNSAKVMKTNPGEGKVRQSERTFLFKIRNKNKNNFKKRQ